MPYKMKYLITGITGFAGPHLANLLIDEGQEVFGLIRGSNGRENDTRDIIDDKHFNQIKWLYADLKDFHSVNKIFKENKFDGVFHLAAQSHPPTSFHNPINTFSDNVMGSINLIECIQLNQLDCKFMFCSTSEVYGNTGKEVGVLNEESRIMPSNPYGVSKAAIDYYVQERCKNGFLNGFITRAFSHTGPRRGNKFSISCDAYQLARIKLGLEKEKVLKVGNLETERVVIDVRDCVRAYYLLMQKFKNGEAYNVGGDSNDVYKMSYFTDKLIEISRLDNVKKEIDPKFYRKIDIQIQIPNTEKLRNLTGWRPEISLDKTLNDLFNYWIKKLDSGSFNLSQSV